MTKTKQKLFHQRENKQKETSFFHSPLGPLEISLLAGQLYSIKRIKNLKRNSFPSKKPSPQMKQLKKDLASYFKGNPVSFSVSLADRGTPFQKAVWRELQKIPLGKTQTYSSIAHKIQKPKAFRAVGQSCGKNPFLIVVPCHRVTGKKGLGGFALGLKAKTLLLNLERNRGI